MASYAEHIFQSKHNLDFLVKVNTQIYSGYWDWHVTVCYYVAVHLVNAHLAKTIDQHYRKHEDVAQALNPNNAMSLTKVPENIYLAYVKLQNLSRRSRYLISEEMSNREVQSHLTYDKHFKRAINYLDTLMLFVSETHQEKFESYTMQCMEGKSNNLHFFSIV